MMIDDNNRWKVIDDVYRCWCYTMIIDDDDDVCTVDDDNNWW